jgi:CPA1 family monovalent cation:H+ antiporter
MHLIEATLLLLLLATVAVPWARRIGVPTEIFLVFGSLALSLIPGVPPLHLDPAIVFMLFLPPILFAGGYLTSWRDFKRDWRAIFLLAFGLVLFTTVLVAVAMRMLGIGVSWPVAFLLGAIVSPPDASAATAIIRKLGVPRRMLTVIEGESLVNDATALIAYKFALAAIVTGSFSVGEAAIRFVVVAVGGTAVGLAIAMAGIFMVRRLDNGTAETCLTLIVSFATYLCADALGFSGVFATVAGGLYFGRRLPSVTTAQTRLDGYAFWRTVLFIINGLVFTLIGLEMPAVMAGLQGYSWQQLTIYGATVVLVVIAVRFVWMFPATYLPRILFASIAQGEPAPRWGSIAAMSWAGMRGIVSLAAALSLPRSLPSGAEFPFRNLLLFLTYVVILSTLLIPSTTLPWLMRSLGVRDRGETRHDETVARIALFRAVLAELERLKQSSSFSGELLEDTALRFERRVHALQDNGEKKLSMLVDEERESRQLRQKMLAAERHALDHLRRQGKVHDTVFFELTRELDIEEMHLRTHVF